MAINHGVLYVSGYHGVHFRSCICMDYGENLRLKSKMLAGIKITGWRRQVRRQKCLPYWGWLTRIGGMLAEALSSYASAIVSENQKHVIFIIFSVIPNRPNAIGLITENTTLKWVTLLTELSIWRYARTVNEIVVWQHWANDLSECNEAKLRVVCKASGFKTDCWAITTRRYTYC